jgi:hypothetical protein
MSTISQWKKGKSKYICCVGSCSRVPRPAAVVLLAGWMGGGVGGWQHLSVHLVWVGIPTSRGQATVLHVLQHGVSYALARSGWLGVKGMAGTGGMCGWKQQVGGGWSVWAGGVQQQVLGWVLKVATGCTMVSVVTEIWGSMCCTMTSAMDLHGRVHGVKGYERHMRRVRVEAAGRWGGSWWMGGS